MNKLAGMTLEGGLHVWDCRQLDVSGRLAEVKRKVGSSTVWTGRHSPHNRELLMVGAGPSVCTSTTTWTTESPPTLRGTRVVWRGVSRSYRRSRSVTSRSTRWTGHRTRTDSSSLPPSTRELGLLL